MLSPAAGSSPGTRKGISPAFRHKLAILDAIAAESTTTPHETRRSPKSVSREEATGASARHCDSSTDIVNMAPGTSALRSSSNSCSSRCSSGSKREPRSPRRQGDDAELDTLSPAGSFYKRRTSDNFRATRSYRIVAPLAEVEPGAHAILAADANFKMHSDEATESWAKR